MLFSECETKGGTQTRGSRRRGPAPSLGGHVARLEDRGERRRANTPDPTAETCTPWSLTPLLSRPPPALPRAAPRVRPPLHRPPHRPVQALPLCLGCCQSASVGLPAPPLHVPGGPLNPPLLKIFRWVTPHVERNPTLYPAHRTLSRHNALQPFTPSPSHCPPCCWRICSPSALKMPPHPPERLPRAAPHFSEGHSWPPAGLFTAILASSCPSPLHTHTALSTCLSWWELISPLS